MVLRWDLLKEETVAKVRDLPILLRAHSEECILKHLGTL